MRRNDVYNLFFVTAAAMMFLLPASVRSYDVQKVKLLRGNALRLAQEGDFVKSVSVIEDALRQTGDDTGVLSDYITILSMSGRYIEAIKVYEMLISGRRVEDYSLAAIAGCYRLAGDCDRSVSLYKDYLERNDRDIEAKKGLIVTYIKAGKFEDARRYIKQQSEKDPGNKDLQIYLVDIAALDKSGSGEAENVYARVLRENPQSTDARVKLARILIAKKKYAEAESVIRDGLAAKPADIDLLFSKAEFLESMEEYMPAYKIYEDILKLYPDSRAAKDLKYRVLMTIGANSLAADKLEESADRIDPVLLDRLRGNEAMVRMRWKEPLLALKILDRNAATVGDTSAASILRSYYDRIAALCRSKEWNTAIAEYEKLKNINTPIPAWVTKETADCYMSLGKAEKALILYGGVLSSGWDPEGAVSMSVYSALVALNRYKEAEQILDGLDGNTAVFAGNEWARAEVVYSRGWLLLCQDRLAEAQRYFEKILYGAPFNMAIRNGLAHTYLWRGWHRRALEEFEIINSIDPGDVSGRSGYYIALDENDMGVRARRGIADILVVRPGDADALKSKRYFDVRDMRSVILEGKGFYEYPGEHSTHISVKFDQPLFPQRSIFTQVSWRSVSDKTVEDMWRGSVGADWRLGRDWWFDGAVSVDMDGSNLGFSGNIVFNPGDYVFLAFLYDSRLLYLSLPARLEGLTGQDAGVSLLYRHSEAFSAELKTGFLSRSDANNRWSYDIRFDKSLTAAALWKTRVALEGSAYSNSTAGVSYFSPLYAYSALIEPMVEHIWNSVLSDRIYAGIGALWQDGFTVQDIWNVKYEQSYVFSDVLELLAGAGYSLASYDGEDVPAWSFDLSLKQCF